MEGQRLSVNIYQLADDRMFKSCRTDGSGWDWSWAEWQRDWMNATPFRHAYRCLPLTIVNQTGWWIKNPVGFTATWLGSMAVGGIVFEFDSPDDYWKQTINSQFGEGIITWNTPFLFRTKPAGSRLLICGPTNYFRHNAQPLTAIIESDWMTMSFTMNYKIMVPNQPVRFEFGEPLFQAIPLMSNVCADLEEAEVRYQRLTEDPEMFQAYLNWSVARTSFHEQKARKEVKPDQWQKDYFQGRDPSGREAGADHMTKVRPPRILLGPSPPEAPAPASIEVPSTVPVVSDPSPRIRRRPRSRRRPTSRFWDGTGEGDRFGPADPRPSGGDDHPGLIEEHASHATNPAVVASCPVRFTSGFGVVPEVNAERQNGATTTESLAEASCGLGDKQGSSPKILNPSVESTPSISRVDRAEPTADRGRVDQNWRRWIAENLLLDAPPEAILEALLGAGVDRDEATDEIKLALHSPYLVGADRLRNRLKKRDWLLATYRRINRLNPESNTIPRRHRLSREQFLDGFYSTNRPVIITGMMDDWPALRKWNLDFFADHFGSREIEVQFGRNAGDDYEVQREKYLKRIKFADFVAMIRSAGTTNDFYLTANNNSSNKQTLPELWTDIVQVPEYLEANDPMNGFFWMGPAGTITPFHHDLTNNFMAQVMGRKKIKIAPSWDLPLMRNDFHVFSRVDGRITPPQSPPALDAPQIIECILAPGEILFLPIGCLHYVEGLEVSVTVSFTNFVFNNDFSSFYTTYHDV